MDQQPEWWDLQHELKDALQENDFERAQQALNQGAEVNGLDEDGTTPLYWAAFSDEDLPSAAARVRWLLKAGAVVSAEAPEDGETSVHNAASSGNLEALALLLAADGKCALEKFDYIGRTPLICAADNGHHQAARLLISAGSDVNAHDESHIGNSALSWAVTNNDVEMVKLLLEAGADPDLPGWMQLSALDRAERKPELRQIAELLRAKSAHGR